MTTHTTPTAAPCLSCGTTGGTRKNGNDRPARTQGYCDRCYMRLWAQGEIGMAETPYQRAKVAHRRAQARVAARQRRFDAHTGPFLPAPPEVIRPMPWPREWGTPATEPLARAAWAYEEVSAA